MSGGHLISGPDRDLLRRIAIVLALVFLFAAAFSRLHAVYSRKFFAATGEARWIWAQHRMSSNVPVVFFAVRDFTLPDKRYYTHLKIGGDPEYTLFVNGHELAGRRMRAEDQREIDLYDVTPLVKNGMNRIVVAVRAPQGVGGLIASIDIAPEAENVMVTDGAWKIFREWHPSLPMHDPPGIAWTPPSLVGTPPIGRWNYLNVARRELRPPSPNVIAPRETFELIGMLPTIRTRSGIAFAVADRARATAFDFGFTRGRVRLIAERDSGFSRVLNVRFANARDELLLVEWNLRPLVLAPGERVVTTPESHDFRYVMVFGRGVRAEVVR